MRSKEGAIIYVGKAKNLADRVKQYFQASNLYSRGWKLPCLLPLIAKIDYVTTASERDALVLEEKLIKRYQPFFNSLGKDGKSYPYLKLTMGEDFPRLHLTRRRTPGKICTLGRTPNPALSKACCAFYGKANTPRCARASGIFPAKNRWTKKKLKPAFTTIPANARPPARGKYLMSDTAKSPSAWLCF